MGTDMAGGTRIEREAAAWLARRDAHGWSAHDEAAFEAWLAGATAHRVARVRLEAAWREAGRLKALGAGQPPGIVPPRGQWTWAGGQGAGPVPAGAPPARDPAVPWGLDPATLVFAPGRRTHRRRGFPVGVAAMLVVLAVSSALGWRHYSTPAAPVAYRTAVGSLESLSLADGTEATLSSDSRIVVNLSRRERHVELERGEAFFHAARDPRRPFVVAAAGHRAVAVGTRFAVRRGADGMRVVVTEGLVRLESAAGADGPRQPTTLLPAGSIALATADGVVVTSGTVAAAEQLLSWRDGFLAFHDTPLGTAVAEFNRYNARKLVLGDPALASIRIGGNFRWSNAEAFARLLEQGFGVRVEPHDDRIVLRDR